MRKIVLLLSLFYSALALPVFSQTEANENIWELLLSGANISYEYSTEFNTYLPKSKFEDQLKKFDNKEITIEGFFLPVDLTGNVFVLSYYPMSLCFFCTGAGYETIIELNVTDEHFKKFNDLKIDNYIKIKGVLKLNGDDFEHLIYILNNVELVEIIN